MMCFGAEVLKIKVNFKGFSCALVLSALLPDAASVLLECKAEEKCALATDGGKTRKLADFNKKSFHP